MKKKMIKETKKNLTSTIVTELKEGREDRAGSANLPPKLRNTDDVSVTAVVRGGY